MGAQPPLQRESPPGGLRDESANQRTGTSTGGLGTAYPILCPRRPFWVVADHDPSLRSPASCDSYLCLVCRMRKVRQAALHVAWSLSRPEAYRPRAITLHDAPATHAQRVTKMRNLRRSLAKDGIHWHDTWTAEPYTLKEGVHLHVLVHGPTGSHKALQARLRTSWRAEAHVSPVRSPGAASGYLTKTFEASFDDALERNGGRPFHTSGGFHHGLTKREVQVEVRAAANEGEILDWHLERAA